MNKLDELNLFIDSLEKKKPNHSCSSMADYAGKFNSKIYCEFVEYMKKQHPNWSCSAMREAATIFVKSRSIIVGGNFFHTHPHEEKALGVSVDHVIVDKEDYEFIVKLFHHNPDLVKDLNKTEILP